MLPRRALGGTATLCISFLLSSCGNLPGVTLGTYTVKGTLESNTCGLGIGAPNPWEFSVLLSQTGTTLYWSWEDGSPLLSGPLSGGRATLTGFQVQNVDTRDGGTMGPCDLQRNDALVLTLAQGTPPPSFLGTVGYTFSVQEGATCTDQLGSSGGMYSQLPCSVGYSVSASFEAGGK
jgi:hypothetical protein